MKNKFTKGRWFAQQGCVWAEIEGRFVKLCTTRYPELSDENKANSKLMAAAPDMLRALESAEKDLSFIGHSCEVSGNSRGCTLCKVFKAIKKAKE